MRQGRENEKNGRCLENTTLARTGIVKWVTDLQHFIGVGSEKRKGKKRIQGKTRRGNKTEKMLFVRRVGGGPKKKGEQDGR